MPDATERPSESDDPLHHVRKMVNRLDDAAEHLREDVEKVDDPLFKAMFHSAALVLDRLVTAFETYAREAAERKGRLQ